MPIISGRPNGEPARESTPQGDALPPPPRAPQKTSVATPRGPFGDSRKQPAWLIYVWSDRPFAAIARFGIFVAVTLIYLLTYLFLPRVVLSAAVILGAILIWLGRRYGSRF